MRHAVVRSIAASAVLLCTSCGSAEPTLPESPLAALPPESRGVLMPVGALSLATTIRWDDADEIVYTTVDALSGTAEVRAVRPENLADRRIQRASVRGTRYENLTLPNAAGSVFLTESIGAGTTLAHRVDSTTIVELTARPVVASRVRNSARGTSLLATRDGTAAVYLVGPDSVRRYDLRTRSSRNLATGCVALVSFSPDDSELLCRSSDAGSLAIVDMATGATRAVPLPKGVPAADIQSLHWGARGITLLRTRGLVMDIVNAGDGATTSEVARPDLRTLESPVLPEITWSPDGTRLAFATTWCPTAAIFCPAEQHSVLVYDLGTRRVSRVASANIAVLDGNQAGIVQLTFSPDGRRLAYVAGQYVSASLYVVSVP